MKKYVFLLLTFLLGIWAFSSSVRAELYLKNMQRPYQFEINGDSDKGFVSTVNGKKYYSDSFTPQFIANFSSCKEYQQSDFGGYVVYQVLGYDSQGRCKYRKMSNNALVGGNGAEWSTTFSCSLSRVQISTLAKAMSDTRANKKIRSFKVKGVEYSGDLSYYDYLMWYFTAQGFCKN